MSTPESTLRRWAPSRHQGTPRVVELPPMQVNVLDSLCEGKANRGIATDWDISEDTVKTHLKRIFRALGAVDRVHAVVLVLTGAVEIRQKQPTGRWAANPDAVGATLGRPGPYPPRS